MKEPASKKMKVKLSFRKKGDRGTTEDVAQKHPKNDPPRVQVADAMTMRQVIVQESFWSRAYFKLLSKAMTELYDSDPTFTTLRYENLDDRREEDLSDPEQVKLSEIFRLVCEFRREVESEASKELEEFVAEEIREGKVIVGDASFWDAESRGLENRRRAEAERERLEELSEKWEDVDDEDRKYLSFNESVLGMLPHGVAERAREVKRLHQEYQAKRKAQKVEKISIESRRDPRAEPDAEGERREQIKQETARVAVAPETERGAVAEKQPERECGAVAEAEKHRAEPGSVRGTAAEEAMSVTSVVSIAEMQRTIDELKQDVEVQKQDVQDQLTRRITEQLTAQMATYMQTLSERLQVQVPLLIPKVEKVEKKDDSVIDLVESSEEEKGGGGDADIQVKKSSSDPQKKSDPSPEDRKKIGEGDGEAVPMEAGVPDKPPRTGKPEAELPGKPVGSEPEAELPGKPVGSEPEAELPGKPTDKQQTRRQLPFSQPLPTKATQEKPPEKSPSQSKDQVALSQDSGSGSHTSKDPPSHQSVHSGSTKDQGKKDGGQKDAEKKDRGQRDAGKKDAGKQDPSPQSRSSSRSHRKRTEDSKEVCLEPDDFRVTVPPCRRDVCDFFDNIPPPSHPPTATEDPVDRVNNWVSKLKPVEVQPLPSPEKVQYDGFREHTLCNLDTFNDIFVHDGTNDVPARVLQIFHSKKEFKLHYYERDEKSKTWRLTPNKRIFNAPFADFIRKLQRSSSGLGRMENTRVTFTNID